VITLVFYLEQGAITGPDLTKWLSLKRDFGCELIGIEWKHYKSNSHTDQIVKVPTLFHAHVINESAPTHVYLSEFAGVEFSKPKSRGGDAVYYFGRNSHGFRGELEGLDGLTWANLAGGDMWSVDAARAVLET
jgi:hypothetical protein